MLNTDNRRFSRAVSACLLACLVLPHAKVAVAWGAGGHMVVAYIAYQRLNAKAKREANRLLALPINPAGVTAKSKDFVNASHWADDLRPVEEFKWSLVEHFADFPFSADGTPVPTDLPEADNVIVALRKNVDVLKNSTDDNARAQALRFIIHFVGDIHQPLHCSTRVDSAHPDGDRGGNGFFVSVPDANGRPQRKNLHSYWDGGLGSFPATGPNFAPPPLDKIPAAVSVAVRGNPDTSPFLHLDNPTDFEGWAKESSELAQSKAYADLEPGGTPDAAYRREGIRIARRRVAWGGYRLAALLNSIFPPR
jgi:S1/P1 Nuclease